MLLDMTARAALGEPLLKPKKDVSRKQHTELTTQKFLFQYTAHTLSWITWNHQYSTISDLQNGIFMRFYLIIESKVELLAQDKAYKIRCHFKLWRDATYKRNLALEEILSRYPLEQEVTLCYINKNPQRLRRSSPQRCDSYKKKGRELK